MELLINGQPLALPLDFEIELEEVNPFFSEVGSQSLPVTLPYSPHNLELLGHPERIAHTFKLDTEHEAVLRHGVFQKVGRLVIFSASKENGIETTFYLNDGEFYTLIKDVHMDYINFAADPDYNPDPFTGTAAQKAEQWMQRFEAVQRNQISAPYAVFPVCTKAEEKTDDNNNKYYEYEYLNEPNLDTQAVNSLYPLVGHQERVVHDIRCPVGYGVTPFLKLNYLLKMLFRHFGYTLQASLFDTDPDLKELVVLNNGADTVCGGKLDYRQLLPDCSVTTFLDAIRNKFCCEFIPNSQTRTITVHFFQHSTFTPDMDCSPFIVGKPLVTCEPFRQLRLSAGTGIEFAEPAAETMEQVIKEYAYSSTLDESDFRNITNAAFNEVFLRLSTGQYYRQTSASGNINIRPIGSSLFNYDKKTEGLEYDERTAGDEQVPVILVDHSKGRLLLPVIGERKHLNTGIKTQTSDEVAAENPNQTDIMLCFYAGSASNSAYLRVGTPRCYDAFGTKRKNLSLEYAGAEGLFIHFWQQYDALLRHAFRKVSCKLQMPASDFLKFNIFTPKLLNGVLVLPVNMKYTISRKGMEMSEVEFRTLRLQLPYNLDVEQEIPQFNASKYYWEAKTSIPQLLQEHPGWFNEQVITVPPPPISYDAPTEQQFLDGETLPQGTFLMHVYEDQFDPHYQEMIAVEYDVPYDAWLEPRKKN
jgi:hypothetical protein